MRIVITGIGFRSALGDLPTTWQRLLAGESAIESVAPFAKLPSVPLAAIDRTPQHILDLTRYIVNAAADDAGVTIPLPDCGIVIGSSRACQAQWEMAARRPQQPLTNWLATLPQSPASIAARAIGAQSLVLAPMAACATGIWSIAQATIAMRAGACQRAIVGAVEAPITPLTIAGFIQMGALATTGCYPFDRSRQGLVLGEAGAVFMLETATQAEARGAKIYAEVLDFGLTNDAFHECAMDSSGTAARQAIYDCLDRSQLHPTEIDYIHAHGTGTVLNDRRESQLIETVFPDGVATSSTKGATGHTLGAAGAVGVALCVQAIATQILPPCVGLTDSEFDLDLIKIARPTNVDRLLCLSFGFGGQNAAIALRKWVR